jgi:trans-aconitate methyltransferase
MTRPETPAEVFDALGKEYKAAFPYQPGQHAVLDWLLARLTGRAKVLDLGSGTGRPVAETVAAAGHDVTGYDVSANMVEIARAQVPAARFEHADLRTVSYPAGSQDVVMSFFSLMQMPRAEVDAVLDRFPGWLAPGGYVVLGTVPADVDEAEFVFMGHRVLSSSYPVEVFVERFEAAGLEIVYREVVEYVSDYPGVAAEPQLYLVARKPE